MLRDSDLEDYVRLFRSAGRDTLPTPVACPEVILRTEARVDGLLHRNDYARLARSLGIACAAGDISASYQEILEVIVRSLEADDHCYLPLTRSEEWISAIGWAKARTGSRPSEPPRYHGRHREAVVGTACRDLRERGYTVSIGALGPQLDGATRLGIAQQVDSLLAQIGGVTTILALCATRELHDGMWLLGNRVGSYDRMADPALPVGWLLSLAIRHIHKKPSGDSPAEAWESAASLATDFAASMDCQRYNPFDGFNLDVPDFLPALTESVKWRELFTLPQVPTCAVSTLRRSFSQITWPPGTSRLRSDVDGLFCELARLLAGLADDGLTEMTKEAAISLFPLLLQHAGAHQRAVNAKYLDPFGAYPRDHERFVFFQSPNNQVMILPSSFTAAAACEAIFRLVWTRVGEGASELVGNVIEKTVALACHSLNSGVFEKLQYRASGIELEIDVALRDGEQIVLFETKAKSLTSGSRTGDMMAFIDDYTKSFLALLRQLVRHDRNIRRGLTPLTRTDERPGDLRIVKIAVSPLSYGPASDHVLQNSLVRAMARAKLIAIDGDSEHVRIVNAFNNRIKDIVRGVFQHPSHDGEESDLGWYMLHVLWFDLGQLLYALHRGNSVSDGVSALKHITASTRDFWTEVALADRMGLTKGKWGVCGEHGGDW